MGRFLLGIFIAVLTLGILLGAGLLLAEREPEAIPEAVETTAVTAAPTEQTLPPETLPPETEAPVVEEPTGYDTVPLYFQTDYPYIKFGKGTMATSGCSVTCLAMVASYLTDQEYTPPQMAHHFGSYGSSNMDRLEYGIAQMQLPCQQAENVQEVMQAVGSGKVAILMMAEKSIFTNQQHFIVVTGMTEDGKFLVNDPMETNYTNAVPYIRNAYEQGFEDFYLVQGYNGGWIFDKAAMPEESFLYDASIPDQQKNRYEGYTLTGEDSYTLACFIRAEAGGEPLEAKQAIAEVVLNRLISGDYPNTVREVIRKTEFSRAIEAMNQIDEPELEDYIAVDTAMYGPYILTEDVLFYSDDEDAAAPWAQLGSYIFYKA